MTGDMNESPETERLKAINNRLLRKLEILVGAVKQECGDPFDIPIDERAELADAVIDAESLIYWIETNPGEIPTFP